MLCEMNNVSSPQIITAVRLWTGWGESMMPFDLIP
jgi:hypothetical protein